MQLSQRKLLLVLCDFIYVVTLDERIKWYTLEVFKFLLIHFGARTTKLLVVVQNYLLECLLSNARVSFTRDVEQEKIRMRC